MGTLVKQVLTGITVVTAEKHESMGRFVISAAISAKHRPSEVFYEYDLEAALVAFQRMSDRYPDARHSWRVPEQFAAVLHKSRA